MRPFQENWHKTDLLTESFERRQEHIRLGVSYAALGHEGRRVTAQILMFINIYVSSSYHH